MTIAREGLRGDGVVVKADEISQDLLIGGRPQFADNVGFQLGQRLVADTEDARHFMRSLAITVESQEDGEFTLGQRSAQPIIDGVGNGAIDIAQVAQDDLIAVAGLVEGITGRNLQGVDRQLVDPGVDLGQVRLTMCLLQVLLQLSDAPAADAVDIGQSVQQVVAVQLDEMFFGDSVVHQDSFSLCHRELTSLISVSQTHIRKTKNKKCVSSAYCA